MNQQSSPIEQAAKNNFLEKMSVDIFPESDGEYWTEWQGHPTLERKEYKASEGGWLTRFPNRMTAWLKPIAGSQWQAKQVEQPAKNEPTPELLETVKIALFYRDFGVLNEYLAGIGEKKIESPAQLTPVKGDDVISKEGVRLDVVYWGDLNEDQLVNKIAKAIETNYSISPIPDGYCVRPAAPQAGKWVQASERRPPINWKGAFKFVDDDGPQYNGGLFIGGDGLWTGFVGWKINYEEKLFKYMYWLDEGSTDKNETQPSFSLKDMLDCWHQAMFCGGKESYFKEKFGITV